jgi:serine phosphatase RsbU (regulator of sigma subunit)
MIRAIWSKKALEELYANRRALNPSEENRTTSAMIATVSLFALTLSFLLVMAWQRQNTESYLETRQNIVPVESQSLWNFTTPTLKDCISGSNCLGKERQKAARNVDLHKFIYAPSDHFALTDSVTALASLEIPKKSWETLSTFKTLMLSFPSINYRRADVYIDGNHTGTFFDSQSLTYAFDPIEVANETIKIELLLETTGEFNDLVTAALDGQNTLQSNVAVMTTQEWNLYREFLASDKAGRGNNIGVIARIVMAVFVLVLFLIIDGSPETLGLGLFLGFEAFAISLAYNWLPFNDGMEFIKHYCYQMGDIFRLYFFLQLARVIDKKVASWLLIGSLLSIPYGIMRQYGPEWDILWPKRIPHYRDMTVGIIGTFVCIRAAIHLRGKKLPWRVTALCVAALASFEQCIDPIANVFPIIYHFGFFKTFTDILQPASTYLVAFSAFINISTMENRVKELSEVESKAKEIEHEMELGRTVQRAFLTVPSLPLETKLSIAHEAMLYVSGDTFYVSHDSNHNKVTFLINDLTGHGIQAALKASAVSVIARSLWEDNSDKEWRTDKLKIYESQMQKFLCQMMDVPDIIAMGGGEFDPQTGELRLYRANFPFPVLIEPIPDLLNEEGPFLGEVWNPRLVPVHNQAVHSITIKPGSFVAISSDGFIESSRIEREFIQYLRRYLSRKDEFLTADDIKEVYVKCDLFKNNRNIDDRTLMVFQWDAQAIAKARKKVNLST